jgi:hypothetical protein
VTSPEFEAALLKALRWAGDEFGEPIEPMTRLRRRVRVAPVSALLQLQRAFCAVELAQGVRRG